MEPPFSEIRASQDRSWTARLLRALRAAPDAAQIDEITSALSEIADPRALVPLRSLLEDAGAPAAAREAAGRVLRGCVAPSTRAERLTWWRSGDPVLQAHALLLMERGEAGLIEGVAANREHPLYHEAILSLTYGFQEPRFQRLKIEALSHPDPAVREAGCEALLWDEPVAAEQALLAAAEDPAEGVAVEAIKTLAYYRSRRVLGRLAALRGAPRASVRAAAEESFGSLRDEFEDALRRVPPAERARLLEWAAPVRDLLELSARSPEPAPEPAPGGPSAPASPERPEVGEIEALFKQVDGPWAEKKALFGKIDWAAYSTVERARLAVFLLNHTDPWLREAACRPLRLWQAQRELSRLARDSSFLVRKSATYSLGETLPASAEVARWAWSHLHEVDTASTHAYETLEVYVRHAPAAEAIARLRVLARDDERESVRLHAIYALGRLEARDELASLLDLLSREPPVTWALHIALLCEARELGLSAPDVASLRGVDDLALQVALAPFLA